MPPEIETLRGFWSLAALSTSRGNKHNRDGMTVRPGHAPKPQALVASPNPMFGRGCVSNHPGNLIFFDLPVTVLLRSCDVY
jgi:hypothetical protein